MLEYFKRNQLKIAILTVIFSFFFILASQTEEDVVDNWFSATVNVVVYPFQLVSHSIETFFSDTWNHYIWLIDLDKENELLRYKIKDLQQKNSQYIETAIAYDRLLDSLEFKQSDPDEKVFAEVVAVANEGYSRMLVLNKGTSDGIRKNFAVVTPEGIVGKIQSVTLYQSVVQLVIDPRSQFPAMIQRSRNKASLSGTTNGTLQLKLIPRRLELNIGDRIIASGLAGIFPKGSLVGHIESIDKKEFGLFQEAVIAPAVDFSRIEEVFVIISTNKNIHDPLFTNSVREGL